LPQGRVLREQLGDPSYSKTDDDCNRQNSAFQMTS
jgi:hypothetical protein